TTAYPVDAKVTFNNVTYSGLSALLNGERQPLEATVNGEVTATGPTTKIDALRATLQLSQVEAHSVAGAGEKKPRVNLELRNEGPVVVALDRGVVNVRSARIVGPYTNLNVTGTASLQAPQTMNLRADGSVNLEALEAFSP